MVNGYASFATVRVMVSFYPVATDDTCSLTVVVFPTHFNPNNS